jgi:hypothetical protein
MVVYRAYALFTLWLVVGCKACGKGDGGDGAAGGMDNLWYYGVIISIAGSLCMNFGQVRQDGFVDG